jgi:glycosyltransferase involved in cell wall biosynthesis
MPGRVLHILSQRPSHTGSGITLDALVRGAAARGWEQAVLVGVPEGEPTPEVGGLPDGSVRCLRFGGDPLPFPVPGMSDVMPYESSRFRDLDEDRLRAYLGAWAVGIDKAIEELRPTLIHSHHIWLVSSIIKDVAPWMPVVTHCHGTGFRQMILCPHLARGVADGCGRNERFASLHAEQADMICATLRVDRARVHVVGAGYRDDIFNANGRAGAPPPSIVYVGKYSRAKGLPFLLDAFERVRSSRPEAILHVAGDGSGPEADELRARMRRTDGVILHGMLSQRELAGLMRTCTLCALPSFFEGLPLVLVEALACGCRVVATELPGVRHELAPRFESALHRVPVPMLIGVDTPVEDALPGFVGDLASAIAAALDAPPLDPRAPSIAAALSGFTWASVFERVERIWAELLSGTA